MSKDTVFNLLNKEEMYYPEYFNGLPSEEEQFALLTKFRSLNEDSFSVDQKEYEETEKSFKFLNEILEKRDYFDNVRNITNQLLSNKDPTEVFSSMFPSNKVQAEIYRSQFTDACDLILNKEHVDWSKLNLPWFEFKNEYGMAGSVLSYDLKINWNVDYWTQEAKNLFFKFWRDRYSKTVVFMSPAKLPAGGVGFFDAENEDSKITTFKFVFYENHNVNIDYHKRRKLLTEEQKISQEADRYRIHLLLEAERLCWKLWREKNMFTIKEGDPIEYISRVKRKNEQNEIAFKEAFSMLIEYDRAMGLPITDPDRDFKFAEPINVAEYQKWLTRKGRVIEEGSDESMFIKNLFQKDKEAKIKPMKFSFIPIIIEEFINEQARSDRQDEIIRNQSGQITSINGKKQSVSSEKNNLLHIVKTGNVNEDLKNVQEILLHNNNNNKDNNQEETVITDEIDPDNNSITSIKIEDENIDLTKGDSELSFEKIKEINADVLTLDIPEKEAFKNEDDLNEKFSNVLSAISEVSEAKRKIEKQGFVVVDSNDKKSIPKGNPYLDLFENDSFEPDTDVEIKEAVDLKLTENKEMNVVKTDEIYNEENSDTDSLLYGKMLSKIEGEDQEEGETSGENGQGGEKPVWIKEGMLATTEDRQKFNEKRNQYIDRKKRIKSKTKKVFDRNKQIEKMKNEWQKFPPIKEEGGFWDLAISKIGNFKDGAAKLWENRVKFNNDVTEKKKISFIKNIADKFNRERKNKYKTEEVNIVILEEDLTVKKRNKLKM